MWADSPPTTASRRAESGLDAAIEARTNNHEDGASTRPNCSKSITLTPIAYSHVTVHGFRLTFATWAEECTEYPDGVREAALAHKYKSETTAAYQRGQKLEKRRVLMKDWAQFLAGSNVIRLDKAG